MTVHVKAADYWKPGGNTEVCTSTEWRSGGIVQVRTATGWRIGHVGTPKLVKGAISSSSISMNWQGITDVNRNYEIYRNGVLWNEITGSGNVVYSNTGGISGDTYYSYKVRVRTSDSSGVVYGPWSNEVTAYSGKAEVRDVGSITDRTVVTPDKKGSWRSDDNWAWLNNIAAQGRYTTQYGNYKGVFDYGGDNAARDGLRAQLGGDGAARQLNGTCTGAQIYIHKVPGVGTNGTVRMVFFRTNTAVDGGEPNAAGTAVERNSPVADETLWIGIGSAHGQALGDGNSGASNYTRGVLIRNNGTGNYAQFKQGRLRLSWSWDYQVSAAKHAKWL